MDEYRYIHVEEDDPRRCQGVSGAGQCTLIAIEGTEYCPSHGGAAQATALKRKSQRRYRLAKYQDRVNELADGDDIKHLGEEIAVLRMCLEEVIKACAGTDSPTDILLYSPKIADLVDKIQKLVVVFHKLEASAGTLLDKGAAVRLAQQIVEIVGRHVSDADTRAKIAAEIGGAIASIKSSDDLNL